MLARQCIFICGRSIFTQAIAATLTARPDVDLRRFDAQLPHIAARLMKESPALIILEQNDKPDPIALTLMRHNQPLLMLNTQTGEAITFTGKEIAVTVLSALML